MPLQHGVLDIIVSDPVQIIDFKQSFSNMFMNSVLTVQAIENGFFILRVLESSTDQDKQVAVFLASASCKQISY